jgi:DCN1-like protein 1/2
LPDALIAPARPLSLSTREARRYLDKHLRLDIAVESYLNSREIGSPTPSSSQLEKLFNQYKGVPLCSICFVKFKLIFSSKLDSDDDDITVDGTLSLCKDLGVDPEDVVLLAVACELQSPSVGRWKKAGWLQGWRGLRCVRPFKLRDSFSILGTLGSVESFEGMKATIPRLRKKLGSDPVYFRRVYIYTFEFARAEGQRSLGLELALAFWGLLLPHGLKGGALRSQDPGGDDLMKVDGGWTEEHTQLWYEFLSEKHIKGISKDTWAMARILSFFRDLG